MEINKKNEIDVTENNPIIEKNKVPQPEMKSGLQEKKNLRQKEQKLKMQKKLLEESTKFCLAMITGNCHGLNLMKEF